jgi:hypothetical protein
MTDKNVILAAELLILSLIRIKNFGGRLPNLGSLANALFSKYQIIFP